MAMEPETVTPEGAAKPRAGRHDRRFWTALGLSAPLVVYGMAEMVLGHSAFHFLSARRLALVEMALAAPVVLWAGWPLLLRAWRSIVRRSPNMFTLIGLGTGTAFSFSVIAALFPEALPAAFRKPGAPAPLYFEPAAAITHLGSARPSIGIASAAGHRQRHPRPSAPRPEERAPGFPGRL